MSGLELKERRPLLQPTDIPVDYPESDNDNDNHQSIPASRRPRNMDVEGTHNPNHGPGPGPLRKQSSGSAIHRYVNMLYCTVSECKIPNLILENENMDLKLM